MNKDAINNVISLSYDFVVRQEHLDNLNHVNNVIYLKWVQEASEKHWTSIASQNILNKYAWMVVRHEIDYSGQAYLNDQLTVLTWIGKSSGVKSMRYVQIKKNNQIIVKCISTWCLLDRSSLKPTRISSEILKLLSTE